MEEIPNSSQTPPPAPQLALVSHHHKTLFILGSLFVVVMLLAISGMVYFQNYSGPLTQQWDDKVIQTPQGDYKWIPLSEVTYRNDFYVKDNVIYWAGYPLKVSDPSTVLALQNASTTEVLLVKDKNYVYDGLNIGTDEPVTLVGADPATFEPVFYYDGYGVFYKDKENVYLGVSDSPLPGADPQTFAFVGVATASNVSKDITIATGDYFKDKNQVYFLPDPNDNGATVVEGADPTTFELSSTTNSFDAQDKNHKYLMGQVVGTTSEQTSIGTTTQIYFQGQPTLFEKGQDGIYYRSYADDKGSALSTYHLVKISNADLATFQVIAIYDHEFDELQYAKDKNNVYVFGTDEISLDTIPGALPDSFVFLNAFYAKDNNRVFYIVPYTHVVEGADPLTFKVFDTEQLDGTAKQFDSQDKNHTYNQGNLVQ